MRVANFVKKPWGSETWIALNEKYCFKKIIINRGYKTSLQYHEQKRETNFIHSGRALITEGEHTYEGGPGTIIDVPAGVVHRIEALEDLTLFEVSTPEVDDVVRLEDSYGRKGTKEY